MDTDLAREQVRQQLREGLLEEQYIEIQVTDAPKANNLDLGNEGMSIAIRKYLWRYGTEKNEK